MNHWQRRKAKRKRERERRERRAEKKSLARAKPSMITHRVPATPARQAVIARAEIDAALNWYAVATAARGEDRASRALTERGVANYLPMESVTRVRRGRRVETPRPALPRYLFVGLPAGDLAFGAVREAEGVKSLLGVAGEPERVRAAELRALAETLASAHPGPGAGPSIAIGDTVRISRGQFAGFDGVVDRVMASAARLRLTMFGRPCAIRLPLDALAPA